MAEFTWLVALALRSTVVLLVALGLGWLLRRSSATSRHRLLTATAVSLLALPVLPEMLPSLELPLTRVPAMAPSAGTAVLQGENGPPRPGPGAARAAASVAAPTTSVATAPRPRAAVSPEAFGRAAAVAWLLGVLASLAGLGRALLRERRLLAGSRPLEGPWREALDDARRTLAIARPVRLLSSEAIEAPLSGGWSRPAVLLPSGAEGWPEDARRMVVQHELVHVARGDGLRRLAWRLAAALYWFHPLARIAERHARLVGEHACDEEVIRLGTRPSLYARRLLEMAEALRGRPAEFASALPMVEHSQLERRVIMILDKSRATGRGRGVAIAGLAILSSTVVGVACASPARPESAAATPPQVAAQVVAPAGAVEDRQQSPAGPARVAGFDGAMLDDNDFTFRHSFGNGLRLNARVDGPVVLDERTGEIRALPRGSSVQIETLAPLKGSQQMLITEEQGALHYEWWLNGRAQAVDDDARAWLGAALEALAAFREIGEIQGQVGSLQGQIGSIQGHIGSLQGNIGSIQGEEGSLQGRIGSIQGEQGALSGQIGSHEGAIGSLRSARSVASEDLRKLIDRDIQQHEASIRELEARRDQGDLPRRLADAEAALRAFQQSSRGKIAELERQIDAIRNKNEIGDLEKDIEDLHANERIHAIELRVAPTVERLEALIRKLGS
jgi:beta-lactamase regulating signal transducer with metallopeptidase domain